MDACDDPDRVKTFIRRCSSHFEFIYGYCGRLLREHGQPSATWIGIPSPDTIHIPDTDLSAMMSPGFLHEFALPRYRKKCA
ncbi:MAG: hypothetical protein LBI02_04595 [Opitutaceae bacterium]|jgi:hypothetical protein|nr:hypothetical protein [Opitutaceae bacterium]